MRDLRKAALWGCLASSVSLAALPALAQAASPAPLDEAIPLVEPAEPSFHDGAGAPDLVLPLDPAPVTIEAAETKPAVALDIPLPEPAPVAASLRQEELRIAVAKILTDDSAMRELRLNRRAREGLIAFYRQAERPLLWVDDSGWSEAGQRVMERLRAAHEDGLDPADYPLPPIGLFKEAPAAQWAEAELKLSAAAIRYARDARGGRIDLARLSPLVTPKLDLPDAEDVLSALAKATEPGAALQSYNPPHPGYRALKERLAALRANHPSQPSVQVPRGPALKVGMQDPRVPLIRARFNLGEGEGSPNVYDERIASAVAAFQKEKGLPTTGILTAQTVAALSGPSLAEQEAGLIANMERWRWLPADLGERHIVVNVPEFHLRLFEAGQVAHETRVIVGKPETQTPIFSETMTYLVVNPSWTIPPTIMRKEILPALAADPDYAAKKGYRVIRHSNGRISVQQPPGERNALGFLKFMFPNQHAVYLHDTPKRNLFSATRRAFSYGCVRVDQPFKLADKVLEGDGKWTQERLRALIGKGERTVFLSRPLPVHLTYFTLSIDEKGELQTFEDLYGLDRRVRAALGLPG